MTRAAHELTRNRTGALTPDLQGRSIPDLATPEGQALIEQHLEGIDLLMLDNLSALCGCNENKGRSGCPFRDGCLVSDAGG
jgi:hypothetical protein